MRATHLLLLAAALSGSAAPALATPLPNRVVVLELCVDEQATARIRERVTTPLQALLIKLPDVVHLNALASPGSARFELHYGNGAGGNELARVEETLERAGLEREAGVLSRSAELAWPSPDGLFIGKTRCAPAPR